jgi:2-oxoisovalerate dehydrogenase E2 component (dihydrolipoyl transacylase)
VNKEFKLPDVGEGLTEADIVTWRVRPGDVVTINQVIVEIETAKSLVELPSPYAGTVTRLLVDEGTTVDVGTPIIEITVSAGGTTPQDPPAQGGEAPLAPPSPGEPAQTARPRASAPADRGTTSAQPEPERQPVLVGYGVRPSATARRPRRDRSTRPASYPVTPSITNAPPTTVAPAAPPASPAPSAPRALAKPPVRRLARDLGVDLTALTGTGPQGTVTRDDVQRAATAPAVRRDAGGAPEERIAVRGVRKHTAAAMVASAFTAPHVTEFLQIDITDSLSAIRKLRDLPEFAGVKVSPLLLVARALLTAAARHPMINSSWDQAAQEIVVKRYVNLGIAVATERGLIVPSVKGAHEMSLPALARSLDELAATARAGKATPADLSGGTITITNVGVFGVDAGTPILTPGEAAILAFGAIRDMPWVVGGEIAVRKVTTLSLSFDHRIVDGELGSAVLRDVGWMLEDPIRMLAWS